MGVLELSISRAGYGAVTVLRDVAMSVDEGELVAVLGANGAGKTTLMRTISGVLVRATAQVVFQGQDVARLQAHRRVRAGIVHVPEGRHVFAGLTVAENLAMGAYAAGRRSSRETDCERVYDLFPVLAERAGQQATSLSGGQQQMLAIGRGLMSKPRLLMVDEASLGLSPALTDQVLDALVQIRQHGIGVLMVEQNARAAIAIADRAYVLERGTVAIAGATSELVTDDRITAIYLGGRGVRS